MKKFTKIAGACILLMALIVSIAPAVFVPTQAAEQVTYKHVVVVGIDGMGYYNRWCDTPNIDKIFKNNTSNAAWTDYCLASNPNISAECWTSMLTGVNPGVHGITNDIVITPSSPRCSNWSAKAAPTPKWL